MAQVTVQKCADATNAPPSLMEQMHAIADSIRQRAFELFESRNGHGGSHMEDWLKAERDVVFAPPAELVDEKDDFRVRLAVPGFDPKDIQVSVLPDAMVIQAAATHSHEGTDGDVRFCEFSDKKLYRRLEMPASIDVNKVSATLDKGILQVLAPKAAPKQIATTA